MHAQVVHVVAGICDGCNAIDWFKALLSSIGSLMALGIAVGGGLFLLLVLLFRRTFKAVVLALLVCGVAFWAILGGGIGTVGDMVGKLMPNSGVTSQIIKPAPTTSPTP